MKRSVAFRRPSDLSLVAVLLCLIVLSGCGSPGDPSSSGSPGADPAAQRPPDILVILVDTLRASHLGLYGYPRETDPNLQRFASQATVFDHAWASAGCTFPSVNSLLTSRTPNLFLAQPEGKLGLLESTPSFVRYLRDDAGYRTLAISGSPIVRARPTRFNPAGGFEDGFETFDEWCLWKPAECLNQRFFERLDPLLSSAPGQSAGSPNEADEGAESSDDRAPFFAYLHYMDPHGPYDPPDHHPQSFTRPYQGKAFIVEGKPHRIAEMIYDQGGLSPQITERDIEHLRDLYDEEIAYFDSQLPALWAGLEKRGLMDDLLIIFASDHGELFLENGHFKHCRSTYEGLVHVPLLLRLPSGTVGEGPRRIPGPASNIHLAPTMMDYAGLDLADYPELEGQTLRPLLEGQAEASLPSHSFTLQGTYRSVFDGRYKLLIDRKSERLELYDLSVDPRESQNLAQIQPEIFRRLRRALHEHMQEVVQGRSEQLDLERAEESERQLRAVGYL
ncbi:MAG: sulfatase [Acidobacteriota bacterium]